MAWPGGMPGYIMIDDDAYVVVGLTFARNRTDELSGGDKPMTAVRSIQPHTAYLEFGDGESMQIEGVVPWPFLGGEPGHIMQFWTVDRFIQEGIGDLDQWIGVK